MLQLLIIFGENRHKSKSIMTDTMFNILVSCPLFKGLDNVKLSELFEKITCQIKKYKKDQILVLSEDEIIAQLIILEGSVKGEMPDPSGKSIKIEDIESPRPLAPAFLFGSNNRYPVNLIANNPVTILSIPKDSFVKLLQLNEKILRNYLNIVSNKAQFLSNKIKFLSFQSIKEKFANYILELSKEAGSDSIQLPKSQSELADFFGVTRPSLGRIIRIMHDEKIINAKGKNIQILDITKLISLL